MSWVDALALRIDEAIVESWPGIREIIEETFDVSPELKKKGTKKVTTNVRKEGLLVLTNQRLFFLEGQEPAGKKLCQAVKVSLIDVEQVSFEKAPLKPVDEVAGFETHVFRLKKVGKKKEFNAFKKLLDEYCKKRKEQLEKDARKVVRFKIS